LATRHPNNNLGARPHSACPRTCLPKSQCHRALERQRAGCHTPSHISTCSVIYLSVLLPKTCPMGYRMPAGLLLSNGPPFKPQASILVFRMALWPSTPDSCGWHVRSPADGGPTNGQPVLMQPFQLPQPMQRTGWLVASNASLDPLAAV
jgi:hypothetical protein